MNWPPPLPSTRDLEEEARGWCRYANDLAACVDARLVNRRDVWGSYVAPERREAGKQHTYTAPGKKWRGVTALDRWRLARHFRAESQGHVVGLHSTSAEDTSRWGGFDFDAHGAHPPEYLDALADAALAVVERLAEYGAAPLLEDSNGAGGWHVWVYFDAPAPTADVFAWLDALAERARLDFGVAIETFPKQSSARGAFGNWLRQLGRHHTRPHWSRVCRPGEPWASGADAARVILERWPASPASAIPPLDAWPTPPKGLPAEESHTVVRTLEDTPPDRAAVIAAYVNKLPHGQAGTERSNKLFNLARFLRHGMLCTAAEAWPILHAWDAGNAPPLGEERIADTWKNVAQYASKPVALRERRRHAA